MKKKAVLIILVIVCLFAAIIKEREVKVLPAVNCFTVKEVTVRGSSMSPFINPEQTVTALFGYYDCNSIERNDVVLYAYSGNENFLIKFIRAVPGDRWNLKETNGSYEIVVNDVSLTNSEGKAYQIFGASVRTLELYVKDYPVIPEDVYLLLGDEINGSLDATRFGLVGKKDIVAKVEIE